MKDAATWADLVKHHDKPANLREPLRNDPDSIAFVAAAEKGKPNADNDKWHFANLPLGATDYATILSTYPNLPSPSDPFASQRDVVHVINVCIKRLRDETVANFEMSPKNALRLLVHLVGDLHQPLHVGSGYFAAAPGSPQGLIVHDPEVIAKGHLKGDQGGNSLFYKDQPAEELHAHWDADLAKRAVAAAPKGTKRNVDDYATYLAHLKPAPNWNPQGSIDTWAEQWANESLATARTAYSTVTATSTSLREYKVFFGHQPPKLEKGYPVELSASYDKDNAAIVRDQLAKAGYRLARLLDTISP